MSYTIEEIRRAKEDAELDIVRIINQFESKFHYCFMKEIIISRNESIQSREFEKPFVTIKIQLPI